VQFNVFALYFLEVILQYLDHGAECAGNEEDSSKCVHCFVVHDLFGVVVPNQASNRKGVQDEFLKLGNFDDLALFIISKHLSASTSIHQKGHHYEQLLVLLFYFLLNLFLLFFERSLAGFHVVLLVAIRVIA
jgi:hypothetical protein